MKRHLYSILVWLAPLMLVYSMWEFTLIFMWCATIILLILVGFMLYVDWLIISQRIKSFFHIEEGYEDECYHKGEKK